MAQNDLQPIHSSSEEEDDEETSGSDSEEVSDTDSGEKQTQEPKKALTAPPQSANKRQPPDLPSSEEESSDDDTDSDSDSPPKTSAVADPNAKPISSIPMERRAARNVQSDLVKGVGLKTTSTPPPAKSKRPAPAAIEKDAKKAKQITANGDRKKSLVEQPDPASSEEELSDSDTDSDSVPPPKTSAVADPNIKPISSKPMERETPNLESKSAKKSGSKSISTSSPAKSKQPAPKTNETDLKKAKKNSATDEDSKKQLFQRLWSEDDEIVVLQGMIDFKTKTNSENPIADPDSFHAFIRKSLHADFSRTQLMDKIRRLRKKYVNNASKEKKDGKDRHFAKSHEHKAYELSKLIWGSSSNSNTKGTEAKKNESQKNNKSKATAASTSTVTVTTDTNLLKSNGVDDKDKSKMVVELEKKMDISRFVQYGLRNDSSILSEEIVKAGMELIDDSKRAELEVKWKILMEQELELYVKRMELLKEQALVVLEAVKSSGN